MSVTREDFAKLLTLQDVDKEIDACARAVSRIPEEIAAIRADIEKEKERLQGLHDRAKEIQVRRKDKENEMASKEEAIRKHQGELNQVKTNEAFKALQTEIDAAKAQVGELETDILTLMDEGDAVIKEEKTLKVELAAIEAEKNKDIQALEAKKAVLAEKLAEIEAKRKEIEGAVQPELFTLYEATRKRRAGIGLSKLDADGGCSVCRMKLPPQVLIDVKKCNKIATCGSCQRILHDIDSTPAETP